MKESIHIYFEKEQDARTESFRSGSPLFISWVDGVRMWSIRAKVQYSK